MKSIVVVCILVLMCQSLFSQVRVHGMVLGKDTTAVIGLPVANIYSTRVFKDLEDEKRFKRLIYNIKKVYPYAKKAGENYENYLRIIEAEKRRGKQLRAMAPIESELKKEYAAQLKKLTFNQGRLLIKLLDRETKRSSYELIKTFRGGFKAFWWQTFASTFNMSLKTEYDPEGEDWEIELVVKMIENGQIKLD